AILFAIHCNAVYFKLEFQLIVVVLAVLRLGDGTKQSTKIAKTPEDGIKASPKTSPKPVSCKKCNKEIPAGTPFYEVDRAPKCEECCT
ncbi:hypothetical protein OSTOST_12488, partial [Ostertagia ostertagi]